MWVAHTGQYPAFGIGHSQCAQMQAFLDAVASQFNQGLKIHRVGV